MALNSSVSLFSLIKDAVAAESLSTAIGKGFLDACLAEAMYLYFLSEGVENPRTGSVEEFQHLLAFDCLEFCDEEISSAFRHYEAKMDSQNRQERVTLVFEGDHQKIIDKESEDLKAAIAEYLKALRELKEKRDKLFFGLGIKSKDSRY